MDDRGTSATGDDVNLLFDGANANTLPDAYISGDSDNDGKVDFNESWVFKANLLVNPLNATTTINTNTATVTGHDDEGTSATDTDTASVRFVDYGQISPTGTTVQQYINGTAMDFSDHYASQGGVIKYSVNNQGKIGSTNPGVFFYYTGLSNSIKGFDGSDAGTAPDLMTVRIDQSDSSNLFGAFTLTRNDVKLYKVTDLDGNGIDAGDTVAQVQLNNSQIGLGTSGNLGDVTVNFTPDAVGSLYVISVKYSTGSVVGTNVGKTPGAWPTVNYTFNTDVGNNDSVDETAVGGITIAPKFAALTLDSDPALSGHAPVLEETALQSVIDQAIAYWAQQGANADDLATLRETEVQISNLGGKELGLTDAANSVTIDDDAAGYGWFTGSGEVNLQNVNLLSVVAHEFGHVLGYDHDVMDATLAVGERDLPQVNAEIVNDWSGAGVDDQVDLVGVQYHQIADLAA